MFHQSHSGHTSSADASSIDEAFAEGMIEPHQMAVDMSELILKYTKQKDVTKLAKNIIKTQQAEIRKMNVVLKERNHSHH